MSAAHSRFAINLENHDNLPIFPLLAPDDQGGRGVLLVGDYVANDFVEYQTAKDPDFRDRWLLVSTTQSDTVPADVDCVDLHLFSNASGEEAYRAGRAGNIAFSLAIADGLFVDPEVFTPPREETPSQYDIMYVAKWFPTKNTELLVDVARERPDIRIGIYGWLLSSERKRRESERYRDTILSAAGELPNVTAYDSEEFSSNDSHINPDGSVVPGPLTKEEIRDRFIYPSRMGAYLSAETEAVNRFAIETLLSDRPLIVTLPTRGGMERFMVDGKTSLFCQRTPGGIIEAYDAITEGRGQFTPRESALTFAGKQATNGLLRALVQQVADAKGVTLSTARWNDYGGDLWSPYETYGKLLG